MIAIPTIGSWVWGDSGKVCQVLKVQQHPKTKAVRLVVICPEGQRVIPLEAVKGMASDKSQPLKLGDRALIISAAATGIVAHFDDELGIRLNNIEGLHDPVTGYEILSQWFPPSSLCFAMQEKAA